MNLPRVLFLVRRVGPYHDARFEAAGRRLDLVVTETRPDSTEYPWTTEAGARHYQLEKLGRTVDPETGMRGATLKQAIGSCFDRIRPSVVVCTGWADPEYHAALRRCHALGIPAVVMSDSTYADEPRRRWKEATKAPLVRGYAAAVVAGSRSRDYLLRLGFPGGSIFQPWDVVDNRHFEGGAELGRRSDSEVRARLQLPARYFLCVARFVPKKNLFRLIEAYARYTMLAGDMAWSLVLSGAGPLEEQLRARVTAAGLGEKVCFPGFLQYPDLPAFYGLAGALVLPSVSDQWGLVVNEAMAAGLPVLVSSRCGCAPELVRNGENGFTFDPDDVGALARRLAQMAGLHAAWRAKMGRRSREIIAAFSPEAFATGLDAAVDCALCGKPVRTSRLSRVVVNLLTLRPSPTR